MNENVQETRPPEPPPKPVEVPKPTEQSSRSEAKDQDGPHQSQLSAQQEAREAARAEFAKAMSGREQATSAQETSAQETATQRPQHSVDPERSNSPDETQPSRDTAVPEPASGDGNPPGGHSGSESQPDEARQRDPGDQSQADSSESAKTDQSAETAARLSELRTEGHGPQRHHDPTDQQLADRMGDPVLHSETGLPELKSNGHVKAKHQCRSVR